MNKVYVIAPLIGLGLFSGLYARHARQFDERVAETKRLERLAAEEKAKQQTAAQAAAMEAAQAAIHQRKQEKAELERIDEQRRQARLDVEQRRLAAVTDEQRLRTRLERLRADLTATDLLVQRTEREKRELQREQAFIENYVQRASGNRNKLIALLEKIETSERARLDAEASPKTNAGRK